MTVLDANRLQCSRFKRHVAAQVAIAGFGEFFGADVPAIQRECDFGTIGKANHGDIRICPPVPAFRGMETTSAAATRNTEINHRLVAPETLPEPAKRFFKAAHVKQSRPAAPVRPGVCLAEIIRASPEKLAGDESICLYRKPGIEGLTVLAAVNHPLRKFPVIISVTPFLIIVTDDVEQFRQTDGV